MIHIKDMDAETLDILISDYNRDNGFRIYDRWLLIIKIVNYQLL